MNKKMAALVNLIMNKKVTKKQNRRGFSLGEVLLAAFIVGIVMVSILKLMVGSMLTSIDSRNNVIATQLAQEGSELAINMRDNNWVNQSLGESFENGIDSVFPDLDESDCRVDKDFADFLDCSSVIPDHKMLYLRGGFYVHDNLGFDTRFQRKIEISYDTAQRLTAEKMTVKSVVVWNRADGDFPASCTVSNQCAFTQASLTKWGEK